ncbi:MAG: hypothetical protein IT246_02785, partial [Bacteroidia bacterium]|nr:hypothetical protein [Bacteroidia bacterium]
MRKLIYFFVLFLCAVNTQAQQEIFTGTKNKKAYKLFGEAMQAYTMLETRKSAQLLHNCIQMDSNFVDAYMLLADIRERNELFDEASKIYIKVI